MSAGATAHLGDVASFIRGITFKPDDVVPLGSNGSVACMRTKNVQADLDLSDLWGIPEAFVKRDDQYLAAGDLLVSSANSWNLVGKCCWVPDLPWRATFGGFLSALRGDTAKIQARYLYHWFSSPRIQATVRTFGQQTTNISNLNIDRCLRLTLPLPPLPEQRRIAEILDKADALRGKRRAALRQLDALTQSIFLDMFGDPFANGRETVPLKGVADVLMGQSPPGASYNTEGKGIPLLNGPTEFGERHPVERQWTISPTRVCQPGDILFCVRGATAGRLNRAEKRYCLGRGVAAVRARFNAPVTAHFLFAVLERYYDHFQAKGVGSTFINISRKDLEDLPIPRSTAQRASVYSHRVDAVEDLKMRSRSALSRLDGLFASLQARAFGGGLVSAG